MKVPEEIQNVYRNAKCLYTKNEVETALDRMAKEMTEKLSDKNPLFLCVVVGGIIPLGNLLTRLTFPLEIDYLHVTRYTGKTVGGDLVWKVKPTISLKNRTLVIVDDILDTGLTLSGIIDYCKSEGANEVYTSVLVDKSHAREVAGLKSADFTGLTVDNYYVFGYGMDYKEYLRNAPGIFAVVP